MLPVPVRVIRYRFRQGVAALLAHSTPTDADALASTWLAPGELTLFRRLPAHDQRHALRVAGRLLAAGRTDRDLIAAALLHDLAKAGTPECPGRVRLPDRVLRVILGRVAPRVLRRLAAHPERRFGRGLYLAVHHARLGAIAATRAGSTEGMCWLIAHHEDLKVTDRQLAALIAADDATV